jgi:hypothetical protein
MSVGRLCSRLLATIACDAFVREAAVRMAELGIDTLVVLDESGEPAGVLTDRDVVVRCVARGLAAEAVEVRAIMTTPLPQDLILPLLELSDGGRGEQPGFQVLRSATFETLPSLLAIDDALAMVRSEMARQSGSGVMADLEDPPRYLSVQPPS